VELDRLALFVVGAHQQGVDDGHLCLGETLRQVIAEGLAREVRDPRVGFVTVTGVLVTSDLSHARVMVSVPGEEADRDRALEGLRSAAGFLRTRAARVLATRTVPELHFELDLGLAHAARINQLLEGLKREELS
jgi:ribosome-binding factor A